MAPRPQRDDPSSRNEPAASSSRDIARRRLAAARARYERSWLQDVVAQLTSQQFFDWTTIFGAELLWSALPFVILLSSLANESIDDDLSRHIGLNSQGARIVRGLFRTTPARAVEPIVTGLLFALVGIIMVVRSLQVVYERAFDQEHRGWRDLPRLLAWVAVLLGALIAQAVVHGPVHSTFGPVIEVLVRILAETIFFAWTMHFLLAGRVRWRLLIRPALVTAFLWLGLSLFSSLYFSSVIIEDSSLYGTIGVVFTLLTWFMLIGAVIMLGAAVGAVWQQQTGRGARRTDHNGGARSAETAAADRR